MEKFIYLFNDKILSTNSSKHVRFHILMLLLMLFSLFLISLAIFSYK